MLDVQAIRADFPILRRQVAGKPLVYLDNAATSQKPLSVIEAISNYYMYNNANVHRGIHLLSEEATSMYEGAREKVAKFINAPESREIIFTRNATESINLVAYSWGKHNINAGDEIIISAMEHHSNFVPWQQLALEKGAKLIIAELTEDGQLDLDGLKEKLNSKTKLVAITQMSNVLGTITPVKEIAKLVHEVGALFLVDGAQGVAHLPTDVQDIGCDFFVFSFHKMLGPTGVGVLFAKAEILEVMPPFLFGGDMISSVHRDRSRWNELPYKFEAGTPNIADVIGSGAAIDYLTKLGMDNVRKHEIELTEYALKAIQQIDDITVYGPMDCARRGGVISFNLPNIHPHDVGQVMSDLGIAVRAGHHCCQPLMKDLKVPGTARASFYVYNTFTEIDLFIEGLRETIKVMGHVACR
jgi:cysteine desulfurase/selenocysteine lyase